MGERTTGLSQAPTSFDERVITTNGGRADGAARRHVGPPRDTVRQLDAHITALRDELGELVAELDRRRHAALDVKTQVRRHAREVALTGAALVGAAACFVWLGAWRRRRRQRLGARVGRLQHALGRMMDRPERVASEPTVTMKILMAAANAAAAAVIKKVLARTVTQVMERQRLVAAEPPRPALPTARPKSPTAA